MLMQAAGGSDAAEIIEDFNRLNYTTVECYLSFSPSILFNYLSHLNIFLSFLYNIQLRAPGVRTYVMYGTGTQTMKSVTFEIDFSSAYTTTYSSTSFFFPSLS